MLRAVQGVVCRCRICRNGGQRTLQETDRKMMWWQILEELSQERVKTCHMRKLGAFDKSSVSSELSSPESSRNLQSVGVEFETSKLHIPRRSKDTKNCKKELQTRSWRKNVKI